MYVHALFTLATQSQPSEHNFKSRVMWIKINRFVCKDVY